MERTTRWGLVTIVAVLNLGVLAALFSGWRPVPVLSGSMAPSIQAGDLAIVRRVDTRSIEPGDVIMFGSNTHDRVIHRVVSVRPDGATLAVQTRGDANASIDAAVLRLGPHDTVAQQVTAIPYAGWFVNVLVGIGAGGVLLSGLVLAIACALLSAIWRPHLSTTGVEP